MEITENDSFDAIDSSMNKHKATHSCCYMIHSPLWGHFIYLRNIGPLLYINIVYVCITDTKSHLYGIQVFRATSKYNNLFVVICAHRVSESPSWIISFCNGTARILNFKPFSFKCVIPPEVSF